MKRLKSIFSLIFVCIGFSSCIDILDPLNILHDDTEYPEEFPAAESVAAVRTHLRMSVLYELLFLEDHSRMER